MPEGFTFKKWYDANKEELSAKRRAKYRENEEYREKRKIASKQYYWLKSRRAKSIGQNEIDLDDIDWTPDKVITVQITNREDARFGQFIEVPVYHSTRVAKVLRRTSQTLRLWFSSGLLVDVFKRDKKNYRLFTKDQFEVFAKNRHWLSFGVRDFEKHPFFPLVNEQLAELQPDGLVVQPKKKVFITGICPRCNYMNEATVVAQGSDIQFNCQKCGRPITEYRKRDLGGD